jgi:hypothetical protein
MPPRALIFVFLSYLSLLCVGAIGQPEMTTSQCNPCQPMAFLALHHPKLITHISAHCKEISIYVFLDKELRGLSPKFHIHLSVSDLYIPTIGPPIFLQQNRQTDRGNI